MSDPEQTLKNLFRQARSAPPAPAGEAPSGFATRVVARAWDSPRPNAVWMSSIALKAVMASALVAVALVTLNVTQWSHAVDDDAAALVDSLSEVDGGDVS